MGTVVNAVCNLLLRSLTSHVTDDQLNLVAAELLQGLVRPVSNGSKLQGYDTPHKTLVRNVSVQNLCSRASYVCHIFDTENSRGDVYDCLRLLVKTFLAKQTNCRLIFFS